MGSLYLEKQPSSALKMYVVKDVQESERTNEEERACLLKALASMHLLRILRFFAS